MRIGEAAKAVGVSASAIRLWEAKGLLPGTPRTVSGYRQYSGADLGILRFIRQAKALDLTLAEIREVIGLQQAGTVPCDHVHRLLDEHIDEIDRKLADLRQLRHVLSSTRARAEHEVATSTDTTMCRIIEQVS